MNRMFNWCAARIAAFAGQSYAFVTAVLLIVIWGATGPLFHYSDTWQLVVNTATTIVTFLMVALLQNSQTRADQAVQHKLNALADGLADVMLYLASDGKENDLQNDLQELRAAVGLEEHESTSKNSQSGSKGTGSNGNGSNGNGESKKPEKVGS